MRTISFSDLYGLTDAVKGDSKTMTRRKTRYEVGQELGVSERYSDIYECIEDTEGLAAAIPKATRFSIRYANSIIDSSSQRQETGQNSQLVQHGRAA